MQNFIYMSNDWHLITNQSDQNLYIHKYSEDLCQIRSLERLNIKQIDQYTSRQSYSYPYCPRIYKSAIGASHFTNQQILFDTFVVVEHVPFRLGHCECKIEEGKLVDLVKGFIYLLKRYGLFKPSQKMIGSTKQGLMKVWINEDFGSNFISQKIESQKEMTEEIIQILKKYSLVDKNKIITCEDLNGLLTCFRKKIKNTSKQVNFEDIKVITVEESSQSISKRILKQKNLQSNTFLFQNYDNHCQNSLSFSKALIVRHQIQQSKSGTHILRTNSKTLDNNQKSKLKEQANTKITRSNKKCLTSFDVNHRMEKKPQQSISHMSNIGSDDLQLNLPSKESGRSNKNSSLQPKQVLSRTKSEYTRSIALKNGQAQAIEQISLFCTGKSQAAIKNKSLLQTLKQDVDALFKSEKKLPEQFDTHKLAQQFNLLMEMI